MRDISRTAPAQRLSVLNQGQSPPGFGALGVSRCISGRIQTGITPKEQKRAERAWIGGRITMK